MDQDQIEALFTRDGAYFCARWGRPIAPVVFGVDDATLNMVKGAIEAMCLQVGHPMAETDPELGVNLMVFFCRDWAELLDVPDLDQMIPERADLVARLQTARAYQTRIFRYDDRGAIQACFVFVRMAGAMRDVPADVIALDQAVRSMAVWGDRAFAQMSPLVTTPGKPPVVRPEITLLLRAVYDPVMPVVAQDASHALRLLARIGAPS